MTCINCGTESTGKFCSKCGQKLEVKRLTFKEGWHDFWARIYGFDGMFPRTFKDLTFRPGFASMEFIRGNRARYYGPVGYFFLMITCFLLLLSILGLDLAVYMKSMQDAIPIEQKESAFSTKVRVLVADNIKIVAFLIIPIQAFAARYIFFRKQELNFIEHSVLPLYVIGHWYWIQMLEATMYRFTATTMGSPLQSLLMMLYMAFAYTSLVSDQPKWKSFLKGAGVYVVSFLMLTVIISIVMGLGLYIAYAIDPTVLDEFRRPKNP